MKNNRDFKNLESHYKKHVLGEGKNPFKIKYQENINLEKKLWTNEKVYNEDDYMRVANENTDEGKYKRHYKYWSVRKDYKNNKIIKTKSSNYQRDNITYDSKMPEEKMGGLLTTCLTENETFIASCFFRTMNYNIIELLTMAISIYVCSLENKFIQITGSEIKVPGFELDTLESTRFELNAFDEKLRNAFIDAYKKSYNEVAIKYNKKIATKKVLIDFLIETLDPSKDSKLAYIDYFNCFSNAFNLEKTNKKEISELRNKFRRECVEKDIEKGESFLDVLLKEKKIERKQLTNNKIGDLVFDWFDDFFGSNYFTIEFIRELCTIRENDYKND